MSTQPNAFSGLDFDLAIGEVYGLRTWRMDRHGRLRALHVNDAPAWRPGVNGATCQARNEPYGLGGLAFPSNYVTSLQASFAKAVEEAGGKSEKPPEPPPHRVPVQSCRCGFYGYTDPQHEELKGSDDDMPLVLGVIRGTGRTLIGTKGFRCEKAEIVALLDPIRAGLLFTPERLRRKRLLQSLYPDVPLMATRRRLFAAFPIQTTTPAPADDAFWNLP